MNRFKFFYHRACRRKGLYAFLSKLPPNAVILDVGCGNDSSYNIKKCFPGFSYTGIDVADYNQKRPRLADFYIVVAPEAFSDSIASLPRRFDAVISSHNLEHCNDRKGTLIAMLSVIKPGGHIYLSFPCEDSVRFPHRKGTLNYFDDPTHKEVPPKFTEVIKDIRAHDFEIIEEIRRYRPALLFVVGLLQEPLSRAKDCLLQGTWAVFGFESIIWAKRK
jgi:SAM-dependent methyltransferase